NLLYDDKELGHIGVLCLDTNDLHTAPYEARANMLESFRQLNIYTAQFFVDKISSMLDARIFEENVLFERAEQELWDVFNEIKQETFIEKLPQLIDYLPSSRVDLLTVEELKEKELEVLKKELSQNRYNYGNFQISVDEAKLIESVLVQ
ncbi:MAG: hypothetical protein FWG13_03915, partial [Leptospirales bacterium]|nr:hypothetical protein [Leptospirales bacterium]